jgi:thymidylate synthase ThyX
MIEGVTRAFTHQMVRQRTAVFAQESMRFAVKDEDRSPTRPARLGAGWGDVDLGGRRRVKVWEAYQDLIAAGIPAEEARGLLPHDTLTRLHYKTNLRNLADHLGNRLCTQAQFEWRLVAAEIRRAIREYNPFQDLLAHIESGPDNPSLDTAWQFEHIADDNLFQPVCFALGKCPFQASFDRGCTIRDRVDAGEFDKIQTAEWLADPTAGWVR